MMRRGAIMDVVVWLRSLGLAKYEAIFRENDIKAPVLKVECLRAAAHQAVLFCL
jgi:hypothetical protein